MHQKTQDEYQIQIGNDKAKPSKYLFPSSHQ